MSQSAGGWRQSSHGGGSPHTLQESDIRTEITVARAFGVFASTLAVLLLTSLSPSHAATFSYDFGASCSTLTVFGRTIVCSDGTILKIHSSVTPSCAAFSLSQQGTAYTLDCATPNATGLWWREDENGRGTWVSHQGNTLFAVDFSYDATGAPQWRTLIGDRADDGTFAGDVFTTAGPSFSATAFQPLSVAASRVGSGWIAVDDADHLRADFAEGTVRTLVKQQFGPLPACSFGLKADPAVNTNYTDLWWNPDESGWGINLAHQGDTIFAAWFTYAENGAPLFLVATLVKTDPGTYAGDLLRATGPAGVAMHAAVVGTATLTFSNGNSAEFAYSARLPGMAIPSEAKKAITRQIFLAPGTGCE